MLPPGYVTAPAARAANTAPSRVPNRRHARSRNKVDPDSPYAAWFRYHPGQPWRRVCERETFEDARLVMWEMFNGRGMFGPTADDALRREFAAGEHMVLSHKETPDDVLAVVCRDRVWPVPAGMER